MNRPMLDIFRNKAIRDIYFYGEPIIQFDHTEGYWLLFRKPVYRTHEDFAFTFSAGVWKYLVTIKAGFLTDLASTPKLIWWILPPWDHQWGKPAFAHDGFYAAEIFPKWFNDLFLMQAMKGCGASSLTRRIFYWAVKLWGWRTYLAHTRRSIEKNRALVQVQVFPAVPL